MEPKQTQLGKTTTTPAAEGSAPRTSLKAGEYFGEVKAELGRISWTSREELRVYTKIVVVATFALGLTIYCWDLVVQTVLMGLGNIVRLLTG